MTSVMLKEAKGKKIREKFIQLEDSWSLKLTRVDKT